jgi:hypothetical protein
MSHWVKMEVLYAPTQEIRINRLSQFIRVAKKLYDYNNLHSLLAILSGLQSAPIYRLKRTWKVSLQPLPSCHFLLPGACTGEVQVCFLTSFHLSNAYNHDLFFSMLAGRQGPRLVAV